jgi:heat-inducible transcriptional repressor
MAHDMLNERKSKVLSAVVQTFIGNPEPVGSRLVTKRYSFGLSPATIRNIMADLEDAGFLMQPHTSAGRIPTDKGYRFYVDSLQLSSSNMESRAAQTIRRRLESIRDDVNQLLNESARTLSDMSSYLGFAIPVRPDGTTLNRIQLYRYHGKKIVAVLITNEGLVSNKILDKDFGLSQRELNRISEFLNSEFSGRTVDEIRRLLKSELSREKNLVDVLMSRAARICREALAFPEGDIIFSGMAGLIRLPELSERIEILTGAIEEKYRILKVLDDLSATGDVSVIIGSENPDQEMQGLSVVMARYKQGEHSVGSVGMIGPTRMDYSKTIPMVELMARILTGTIQE